MSCSGGYIGGSTIIRMKRDRGWSKRYSHWRMRAEREAQANIKKLAAMPNEYSRPAPEPEFVEVTPEANMYPGVKLLRPRR